MKKNTFLLVISLLILVSTKAQKVVKVGVFNFYPAVFKDVDGKIKGFYIEALNDIEKKENIEFVYIHGSWNEGLQRIKNGKVDLLTSVAITEERLKFMNYTATPLLTVWGEVYVNENTHINGILDLEDKQIAIMSGDLNGNHLKQLSKKLKINCTFIKAKDFEEIFSLVSSGKVDAGVVNNTFGAPKYKEYGLRSSGIVLNPFDIFFTVKKGENTKLLELLNKHLENWTHDRKSVYNVARQKWSHGKIGFVEVIPEWLYKTGYTVILLIFFLLIFITLLRYKVRIATQKIEISKEELQLKNEEYLTVNEELNETNNELILAKEKAEESDQLKTEFMQNMSHEIRTPLNGILGFSSFLKKANLSDEKKLKYIDVINSSGNQLLKIVEDILEISQLETQQLEIIEGTVNFNDLLLKQFFAFELEAKEKKLSFTLNTELTNKESLILSDKAKLNRIISNLLENALKYTKEGFVEFGYKLIGKNIQLYVKDTGIGIKAESQEIIFKCFSQEEKSLVRNSGGLGLGLSIAKENAILLAGNITLESEKGKGTTFFLTIPYKPLNDKLNN